MTNTRVACATRLCSGFLLALCLFSGPAAAGKQKWSQAPVIACDPKADQVRLQVSVSGLKDAEGQMAITVYPDDRKRFLASGAKLLRQRVKASTPFTTACFVLPTVGYYAVAIYHDRNADEDFNRTFIGLPAEGYGFSRNPKTLLGLPDFDEVRFVVKLGDNPLEIVLTYP